jgi:hypothetical protein
LNAKRFVPVSKAEVTVHVQKYLCIALQPTIWIKSDVPEKDESLDTRRHVTLDHWWFLKGFFDMVPIFKKPQLDQLQ